MSQRFRSDWQVLAKQHKYHAQPTVIDGIKFSSKLESSYYCRLKLLQRAGEVKCFDMQVKFELLPAFEQNGKHYRAINYVADFVVTYPDGSRKVIDVKGFETDVYKLKKKMLLYRYRDIDFEEIRE